MNGASAALAISPVPVAEHVGAVRIGKLDGDFVVNPPEEDHEELELDLIVAGTDEAILMVEAGANGVTEAEILDALDIAHGEIKKLVAAMEELQQKAGKEKIEVEAPKIDEGLLDDDPLLARPGAGRRDRDRGQARALRGDRQGQGRGRRQVRARGRRRRGRRASARPRSRPPSARSRRTRSARRSPSTRSAPTAAPRTRSGRSSARSTSPRACTARRCSPAARPRSSPTSPSARRGWTCGIDTLGLQTTKTVLAPLQLPALLGRGGRLHARPEAPRHRPRRARRAGPAWRRSPTKRTSPT